MATDVYERLAVFLDDLPAGFPTTGTDAGLRILRRLFTPEEAEFALHLTLLPEPARVIARRGKVPVEEATERLQEMERKGLIFAFHEEGKEPEYMATHWKVGIYGFQVDRLDPDMVADLKAFSPHWFDQAAWDRVPQKRTIPVGVSINAELEVMPYERAGNLLRAHDRLAVAPCICRQEARLAGESCDAPEETCLTLGSTAAYYIANGLGRPIDQVEALAILAQAEEKGLVLQSANAKDAFNICSCCGCCCGILRSFKRQPHPASIVASAFVTALDAEACEGCGTCELRCQMEAIALDNGHATLGLDRCIGCGLCVPTCPANALSLRRKPTAEQPHVPKDAVDTMIKLGRARGKLTTPGLVGMLVRSKVDRLLAPK